MMSVPAEVYSAGACVRRHLQRVIQASSRGTRYFGLDFKDIEICIGSNQARLVPETKILQIRSQPCARLLRAPSISQFHATGGQCRRRPVTSKEWYSLAAPTRRYSREKAAAARPAKHTSKAKGFSPAICASLTGRGFLPHKRSTTDKTTCIAPHPTRKNLHPREEEAVYRQLLPPA